MEHMFFHNNKAPKGSFINKLNDKAIDRTITMHPIKIPSHQYRVQNHIKALQISDLRQKEILLQKEITEMDKMLNYHMSSQSDMSQSFVSKPEPMKEKDISTWRFITETMLRSNHLQEVTKALVNGVTEDVILAMNKNSQETGNRTKFRQLLYGYIRSDPLLGEDHALDLKLTLRDDKRKSVTAAVRQQFMEPEVIESPLTSTKYLDSTKSSHIYSHLTGAVSEVAKLKEAIHFVQGLVGKVKEFHRFMKLFETICLREKENVYLHVVHFNEQSSPQDAKEILRIVGIYQKKYGGNFIEVIEADGEFSRAKALHLGAKQCPSNALLFFVDVDILLTSESLIRLRLNTLQGTQVYYPIVFSQYDPDTICAGVPRENCEIRADDFDPKMGSWRKFGYGMAAMYRSDLDVVGGFNTNITGWGKEDLDLFDKFVASNLTVFRAVDVGMIHVYHDKTCDPNLTKDQLEMCLGSKAAYLGSKQQLAQMVFSMPDIFNRNVSGTTPFQ